MWLETHLHQDAETVAEGIMTVSGGKIKTGVYHADVKDHDKEGLHRRWRQGGIQVVCATIGKPVACHFITST